MMRYLLRFNWPLALCAAVLTVLGVVMWVRAAKKNKATPAPAA